FYLSHLLCSLRFYSFIVLMCFFFIFFFIFFFFSSRRRHTRCYRDWSSDVCSSDLAPRAGTSRRGAARACSGASASAPRRARTSRSEERRVGKECRSRWSPDHEKKKKKAMRK